MKLSRKAEAGSYRALSAMLGFGPWVLESLQLSTREWQDPMPACEVIQIPGW